MRSPHPTPPPGALYRNLATVLREVRREVRLTGGRRRVRLRESRYHLRREEPAGPVPPSPGHGRIWRHPGETSDKVVGTTADMLAQM